MTTQAKRTTTHRRNPRHPLIQLGKLRRVRPHDLAIRFILGALTSLLAGLIALIAGGRAGGLFLAFPAILLAGLTLVEKNDGPQQARRDAHGAIIGAIALASLSVTLLTNGTSKAHQATLGMLAGAAAMIGYCLLVSILLERLKAVRASLTALLGWLAVATPIYFGLLH